MAKAKSEAEPRDIYQEVTDRVVASLESGAAPWIKPWTDKGTGVLSFPRNGITKRRYNGVNVILLWLTAGERGYTSADWMTYGQAKAAGGMVRKGETGTMITFWKQLDVERREGGKVVRRPDGTAERARIPMLRFFYVFNRAQVDGLPEVIPTVPVELRKTWDDCEPVESFVAETEATIRYGGNRACYIPFADTIQMPDRVQFADGGAFYSTLLHELVHWTGHESRKKRLESNDGFGSESYAFEELVAEMGSAFLCAEHRIEGKLQHPEYIANWIKVLRNDKKALIRAASQARQACEFLGVGQDEEATEAVAEAA